MSIRKPNCAIQLIEIYPMDSAIHLLNNWGQAITFASLYAAYTQKVLYSLPIQV